MPTRLSYICDRVIEAGWLAALVFTPLYFNVYSSRVFEPDKISFLRNIIALATIAWLVKLGERLLGERNGQSHAASVAESATPGWLPAPLRVPMALPLLIYAMVFLFTTITSIVPLTSIFGSYQRFQGTISQLTYIMLAVLIITNMRTRAQLERFITFAIVTTLPVSLYGLMQAMGDQTLPWAGDVQTRPASTMGNAIFVAAYLIMAVPLTLQRLVGAMARMRSGGDDEVTPGTTDDQPWSLAIIGGGAIFFVILLQYAGVITGNNINPQLPDIGVSDVLMWVLVLIGFALFCWAANLVATGALGPQRQLRRSEVANGFQLPAAVAVLVPVVQILAFLVAIAILGNSRVPDFRQWIVLPLAIFVIYALTYFFTMDGRGSRTSTTLQLVALPLLLVMQVVVIFLSQSRGPQLGLIAGMAIFGFALLLRRRMYTQVAALGALAVLFFGFLVIFNLPDSPIASWRSLPYIGRLGLITQLEEGTGKVRTLIWGGATNLILSDPVRTVIGWGPESMYVAYNRFYPPELGRWELRNATPDRSHDVFFDQLVTMGVLGLFGYLFLIGSFIWYSVRALRKAPRLHDQLIIVGFLSLMVSHIIELVAGIQIAASYTYFYGAIGALSAFGYFITNYLRESEAQAVAVAAPTDAAMLEGDDNIEAPAEPALVGARAGGGARARSGVAVPTTTGKRPATAAATMDSNGRRSTNGNGTNGRITPQGPRSGTPRGTVVRPALASFSNATSSPLAIGLYTVLLLLGAFYVVGLNVNAIKADMFYKQGLAADQAQSFQNSILPYEKAIAISPTEDYYYLFLGRAYMELARTGVQADSTQAQRDQAQQLMNASLDALLRANRLNPLNTDHYANLGRLYVFWGDNFGDTSKYETALQYYSRAHELSPGNATIWNEYAVALEKAGQASAALDAMRGSVAMDTSFAQSHFLLGQLLRLNSKRVAAQAQDPSTTAEMSATLTLSATQLMQEAGVQYGESIKIDQSLVQDSDLENRVNDLIGQQAITPVVEAYRFLIDQAQSAGIAEPALARSSLGFILWRMGQTPEAITEYERAVILECTDFLSLTNLGILYSEVGRDQDALISLQNALAVAECNPTANFCATLRDQITQNACQPLTGNTQLTQQITDLRARIDELRTKLGQ